jgi:hypothetical protein
MILSISGLRDEDAEIYRIEIQRHLKVIINSYLCKIA